ncbi:MAG: tyrosine-type recombinase/integrase [Methylobacter sp.]|nr:tyrosine-type recombinase/integrase [Methylobacter sp.]
MTDNTQETRLVFTKKWIEQLPPNPKDALAREKEYSDTQAVGLKLLVSKQGRKFFYLRYTINKRKRGIKVGEFGPMSLIEARHRCNELKAMINKGVDPQEEKHQLQQIPSFGEYVSQHYLPHAYSTKRSAHDDESKLRVHLLPLLQNRRLDQITTQELQRYHDQLKNKYCPATANRHLSLLHRMFKLAINWGFMDKNPATGIRKHQENNERHRYLSDQEIFAFIDALKTEENPVAAAAFELLLYTGVRRQEALDAKWEHVDLQKRTWYIPRSKSGKLRHVILNGMAIELLQRQPRVPGNPYIFPGKIKGKQINNPQKAFARVLKKAGISNFRIHDLRHTHASIAINNGASLYEVQHLLGHSQSKTTSRYAHLADETLRKVSDTVSDRIAHAMS